MEHTIKETQEELIAEILKNAKLKEQNRTCVIDGVESEYVMYYDEYCNTWTSKSLALRGYVFSKLSPTIYGIINDILGDGEL